MLARRLESIRPKAARMAPCLTAESAAYWPEPAAGLLGDFL